MGQRRAMKLMRSMKKIFQCYFIKTYILNLSVNKSFKTLDLPSKIIVQPTEKFPNHRNRRNKGCDGIYALISHIHVFLSSMNRVNSENKTEILRFRRVQPYCRTFISKNCLSRCHIYGKVLNGEI